MPRSASVGGLAKRGVIPRKQFYIKMFVFNTVILGYFVVEAAADWCWTDKKEERYR
jgi:hypothetical protein